MQFLYRKYSHAFIWNYFWGNVCNNMSCCWESVRIPCHPAHTRNRRTDQIFPYTVASPTSETISSQSPILLGTVVSSLYRRHPYQKVGIIGCMSLPSISTAQSCFRLPQFCSGKGVVFLYYVIFCQFITK